MHINKTGRDHHAPGIHLVAGYCFRQRFDGYDSAVFNRNIGMESRLARAIYNVATLDEYVQHPDFL
jgi:hypothetical protein